MSYFCKYCNYDTSDKSNYTKHLNSKKHIGKLNEIDKEINNNAIILLKNNNEKIERLNKLNEDNIEIKEKEKFICKNCNKEYSYNTGYYRHIKKCNKNFKSQKDTNQKDINKDNIKDSQKIKDYENQEKEPGSYKLLLTRFMELEHKLIECENEYKNKIKLLEEENKDLLNKVF